MARLATGLGEVVAHPIQPRPAQAQLGGKPCWIRLARCCAPSYPDRIVGYLGRREVVVHRDGCGYGGKDRPTVAVLWEEESLQPLKVEISLEAYDRPGLLRDVAAVVANQLINLSDCQAHKASSERARVHLSLELRDPALLEGLLSDLRSVESVTQAEILGNPKGSLAGILGAAPARRAPDEPDSRKALGMPNPYSPGRPITRARMFFGRAGDQGALLGHLHPAGQSTLIYGQRRVGKTSLARQLLHHPLAERDYITVYVDLEHFRSSDDGQVLHHIGREIHHRVSELGLTPGALPPLETGQDPYGRFQEDLFDLHRLQGKGLLLLFDEFEALLCAHESGVLSERFFWPLRSWAQNQPVTFLPVGSSQLPGRLSQAFPALMNLFVSERLGPLEPDDARLLIVRPVEGFLSYESKVVHRLISLTACYPYYIHLLCARLFSEVTRKRRTTLTELDMENSLKELTQSSVSFSYYVHLFDGDEPFQKALLSYVAHLGGEEADSWVKWEEILASTARPHRGKSFESRLLAAAAELEKIDTLKRQLQGGGPAYHIELPLFRRWIRHHWPLKS